MAANSSGTENSEFPNEIYEYLYSNNSNGAIASAVGAEEAPVISWLNAQTARTEELKEANGRLQQQIEDLRNHSSFSDEQVTIAYRLGAEKDERLQKSKIETAQLREELERERELRRKAETRNELETTEWHSRAESLEAKIKETLEEKVQYSQFLQPVFKCFLENGHR